MSVIDCIRESVSVWNMLIDDCCRGVCEEVKLVCCRLGRKGVRDWRGRVW